MKQTLHNTIKLVCLGLVTLFTLHSCCCPKPICQGYTGTLTSQAAIALVNKDHFIIQDSIITWTARYQANKALISHDSLPPIGGVLGDSCSFNSCFVKALLCHDSCIGLRVLYGMDIAKKVHIILVGVKPDYSTLYIYKPKNCDGEPSRNTGDEPDDNLSFRGKPGGVEFSQMP